jgi:hypothetical protein
MNIKFMKISAYVKYNIAIWHNSVLHKLAAVSYIYMPAMNWMLTAFFDRYFLQFEPVIIHILVAENFTIISCLYLMSVGDFMTSDLYLDIYFGQQSRRRK